VRRTSIFMITLGLAAAGLAVPGPAAAAPGDPPGWQDTYDDEGGWGAQAGSVTITVSGSASGGIKSPAGPIRGPKPYCRYVPYKTAEEIPREYGHGDDPNWNYEDAGLDPETGLPPDVEERKGTPGRYWVPMCGDAEWLGTQAELDEYIADFFAANNIRWVGPADPLPEPPPVPASVLLAMAEEYLDPPEPAVTVNPVARSVVNIPTWVWADEATFGGIIVRAESGPNWAEITATAEGMKIVAEPATVAAQVGSCASGGTPYVRGRPPGSQSTDCSVVFNRASVGAPDGWPLSVTSTWGAVGTTSDGTVEQLQPVNPTTTVNIVVAEVQAVQAPGR
jgi:hypothetical protein